MLLISYLIVAFLTLIISLQFTLNVHRVKDKTQIRDPGDAFTCLVFSIIIAFFWPLVVLYYFYTIPLKVKVPQAPRKNA